MRLLYLLNISNPQRLSADSGFTFATLIAPALADAGAEVTVAGPGAGRGTVGAAVGEGRLAFEPFVMPGTKYRARFDPDLDALVDLVRRARPDVVVANQVEAAAAVRAALLEARVDARVAGYCHYLPFSLADDDGQLQLDPWLNDGALGRPVLLAWAAGLAACDRVIVHSATAASWATTAAARIGIELAGRLHIVPAPRDERLVRDIADRGADDCTHDGAGADSADRLVGVYNHRLYAHYGAARFTALARRLTMDAGVRLRVLDVLGARGPERVRLDPSPERHRAELATLPGTEIVSDRGDRVRYQRLLAGGHFGIAPFRAGCPWSMSVIDCQAMGLPVIAPRTGWFAEHIDDELLFDTSEQAVRIARRLAGDGEFYRVQAKRALASTAELTPVAVAARYLRALA